MSSYLQVKLETLHSHPFADPSVIAGKIEFGEETKDHGGILTARVMGLYLYI